MGWDIGRWLLLSAMPALAAGAQAEPDPKGGAGSTVRLITLDPGHFHAALIQQQMHPEVSDLVHVYAPLGPDLIAHLSRISQFNHRAENPTRWRLEVHAGPDFLEKMLLDRPGNVVVLSGRNQGKIESILKCLDAGMNVLADKPWIIAAADFSKLEVALDTAERKGLVAYDVMTERYEIATILQRELLADPAVSGGIQAGTVSEPGVVMESVHHVMKTVAGVPNLRPASFFDTREQGEALADVGTHLVDLVPWMLFPEEPVDYRRDIQILSARRWPTVLTHAAFERVTGEKGFPPALAADVKGDELSYYANAAVSYTLRGVNIELRVRWNYEAPAGGGDTHFAVVRGGRARLEVQQGPEQRWRTELYVVPDRSQDTGSLRAAVLKRLALLESRFPGLGLEEEGGRLHVVVPDSLRASHESHFAQVTARFLGYLKNPRSVPAWERANMLAKYYMTTRGTELSRSTAP